MIGALICMFMPQSLTSRLHVTFLNFYKFAPSLGRSIPLAAVTPSASAADKDDEELRRIRSLETEKAQLENHIANLSAELAAEHAKVETLESIRSRFPALAGAKLIDADVIVAGYRTSDSRVMINRGQSDGIRRDQYVLADSSVIGKVQEVWARTAIVKLMTDKETTIAVEIPCSKAVGIMKGTGKDCARIIQNKKHVNKGDNVLTYKNPGWLDVPIIVGKVAECKANDDHPLLWDITVKPVVRSEDLLSVTVVVMNP
jgi:rod shape-determining protein MreC